jgi:3-oxoacyl-[acyl-carrier protein] reductase
MKNELQGKVAVITGAGSRRGIGWETAKIFAREGAVVVINDLNYNNIKDRYKEFKESGYTGSMVAADVSTESGVKHLFGHVFKKYGHVDILINNAGITQSISVTKMVVKDWDRIISINLRSSFLCTKAVLDKMIERKWGRIICISSVAGRGGPSFGSAHYAASKAGMIGFVQALAKEVGAYGITVNAVAPGGIDTDILSGVKRWDGISGKELEQIRIKRSPLGKLGSSSEVGEVIAFLSSHRASYATGMVFDVNGGMHMC